MSSHGENQRVEPYEILTVPGSQAGAVTEYMLVLRKHVNLQKSIALCLPVKRIDNMLELPQSASPHDESGEELAVQKPFLTKIRFNDGKKDDAGVVTPSDAQIDFSKAFTLNVEVLVRKEIYFEKVGSMDDPQSVGVVRKNNDIIEHARLWRRPEAFQKFEEIAYPEKIDLPGNSLYTGVLERISYPKAKASLLQDIERMRKKVQEQLDINPNLSIREARDIVLHGKDRESTYSKATPLSKPEIEVLDMIPDAALEMSKPLDLGEFVQRGLLRKSFAEQLEADYPSMGALCTEFARSKYGMSSSLKKLDETALKVVGRVVAAYQNDELQPAVV